MQKIGYALAFTTAFGVLCSSPGAFAQSGISARTDMPIASDSLNAVQAERRFNQGEAFERRQDLRSAFAAYSDAGESGHPLAQKKLGDFYSTGSIAVARDYEVALKWYQKAREQGVEIPSPFSYPAAPVLGSPR